MSEENELRKMLTLLVEAVESLSCNYGHSIHHYEKSLAESVREFLETGVFKEPKEDGGEG